MNKFMQQLTVIALAVIGLAIVATLVSRGANTAGVISEAGKQFARSIYAATGPVSGGSVYGYTG